MLRGTHNSRSIPVLDEALRFPIYIHACIFLNVSSRKCISMYALTSASGDCIVMHTVAWIARKRGDSINGNRGTPSRDNPTIYTYLHNAPNITNNGTNRLIVIL